MALCDCAEPRGGNERPDNVRYRAVVVGGADGIKGAALEGVSTTPSDCAEGVPHAAGTPCASKKIASAIVAFAESIDAGEGGGAAAASASPLLPTAKTPEAKAVRAVAKILGCDSESCVVAHPDFRSFATENELASGARIDADLEVRFKEQGPRNSTELLSNTNIDGVLRRWAREFPEFFPCPFAMMDFDATGEAFAEIDLPDVLEGKVPKGLADGLDLGPRRCFGCVVNTDVSSGRGKHWVAVFVDCRAGAAPWSVEYFNSSGRAPPKPMVRWMERSRARLADYRAAKGTKAADVVAVPVTDLDHQESKTECGLYALYYIRRRLEGSPYAVFTEKIVPDAAMFKFRAHVFR